MPMPYSEADGIAAHKADLSTMDWRLDQAKTDLNWSESLVLDVGGAGGLHAALLAPRCRRIYFTAMIFVSANAKSSHHGGTENNEKNR